ncbi:cys-tRNA(pro)/cys-tRNA(cys) deacylase [Agaricicola taiwanensis]|uniref:Cys-tRNA(Pro)/cys-tRNA(Cys) deacylase n=1 Tax=Agaricicola taiwanensis TaxID=591372 RepID=A0A8J2VJZ1_9RHOB|nr:YbaK/EbsC family protein [Agaricicola taiwanensis]GGE27557.1 cys-tRNA(pro)/cys-tRNA(cys) deacylase [Agaricicola taiwanensis]
MTALPSAAVRFSEAARQAGIDPDVMVMEQSTRTAMEAAEACGASVAQIVKSLVFQGAQTKKPCLILVSGANRVDEETVAGHLGEPLGRMEVRAVRDLTGYAIGGIPPLGHATPIRTFMDEDLLRHGQVFAAAGTPNTMFSVAPEALRQATSAAVIRVTPEDTPA